MALAPIVLFVYNRPFHTEQTVHALMRNTLASESVLYVFCDGPKENANSSTLESIASVRKVVRSEQWCKEVYIRESDFNKGLACSIKSGVSEIVEKFGKVIVMEDDLDTSPAFLSYMNKALDYYSNRKSVFSISAYNLSTTIMSMPEDYNYDVYVSMRNGSWGWGTWQDRWMQVDWDVNVYQTMLKYPHMQAAFNRGGDDMFEMLQMQQSGKLNIWSIQFSVAHFINHAISIVPILSYVDNIGLDGSGENCGTNYAFKNLVLNTSEDIKFLDVLYQDKRIINAFYSVNCRVQRSICKKIINRVSRLLGYKNIFTIKAKIYL
jgi:hypothetical protein